MDWLTLVYSMQRYRSIRGETQIGWLFFWGGDRVLSGDHGIQKWKASVTSACQGKSLENEMK